MTKPGPTPRVPAAIDVAGATKALLTKLAGVQPAEGTHIGLNSWVWVQAFADFDFEYSYLLDVRTDDTNGPISADYLAVFEGYDAHGKVAFRATWMGQRGTFPNVPNLYDALIWWAQWTKETRAGEHGQDATTP